PNILLILADDLGYGDLSIHGSKPIRTPNIDSIFRKGVQFTQGYVSNSVCAPSRAGLLTGLMGSRFGFERNLTDDPNVGLDTHVKTIPDYLKTANYRTCAIGKWHLGKIEKFHPNNRGFDEFFGFLGGSRTYFCWDSHATRYARKHAGEKKIQYNGKYIKEPEDLYTTDLFTDKTIEFIKRTRNQSPQQPWFVYLAYNAPHGPNEAKPEDLAKVDPAIMKKNRKRGIYCAMVMNLDHNVGRILTYLRETKQLSNTLIVFLSDNGGPLEKNGSYNGPLRGNKGSLWEGGVRVPFAIRWDGHIPAGLKVHQPVWSLDLMPTFLAAAGVKLEQPLKTDGIDLLPYLQQRRQLPERTFFWRRGGKTRLAIRKGPWKLQIYRNREKFKEDPQAAIQKIMLHNIDRDTGEKNDLYPARTEFAHKLKELLEQWEKQMPDPRW
ncbi:MAG: hypothetical protein D6820_06700, partial [Lentisphaerae bacterium]